MARDLGVSQTTAWFMQHRIREAFAGVGVTLSGTIEVDEAYFGGKRKNMSNERREELAGLGRGTVGKQAVVAAKDRRTKRVVARVIDETDKPTLQGFVDEHASPDAKLYTDDATAYRGVDRSARDGQPFGPGIRAATWSWRDGPHQRRGIVLVDAEDGRTRACTTS